MTASRPDEPELTAFEKALAARGEGDHRGYTPSATVAEPTRGPSDPAGVSVPRQDTGPAPEPPEPAPQPGTSGADASG
ncbi:MULTISPECIES: hypothetical protein [unclassified Streptomyces]|uniref:hypothetical protein n=1 Tax=unclassified Streptomyces TaxID=2593676 RepID=UPI002256D2D6|nr:MULTISPECIES: hypothetical protein [unclassified Streptomyces]MCX5144054.1 hypothetical protein [Streptomyces sp. NBC_00338]WRZ68433.1 hypothetical protein OG408_33155 [Streptomyces sp. NBC_01257]WSU62390.1 hypothetical protein OG450_33120 [Streptomyces sp. NBC_01104]